MALPKGYKSVKGSEHLHPLDQKELNPTGPVPGLFCA
jgi:hypothetical protein